MWRVIACHSLQLSKEEPSGLCLCMAWLQPAFVIALENTFKDLMGIHRHSPLPNTSTPPAHVPPYMLWNGDDLVVDSQN